MELTYFFGLFEGSPASFNVLLIVGVFSWAGSDLVTFAQSFGIDEAGDLDARFCQPLDVHSGLRFDIGCLAPPSWNSQVLGEARAKHRTCHGSPDP